MEGPADFYENKHLNSDLLCCNFTELSDDEVYESLEWANKALTKNYFDNIRDQSLNQVENLYRKKDTSFRGFRHGNAREPSSAPLTSGSSKIESSEAA